jgi:membrane fusion protein (multidrug efflux system)
MGVKVAFLQDPAKREGPEPLSLVTASAVRDEGDGKVVYVLKGGRLERRAVTVGEKKNGDVEVVSGVAAGETVVTGGAAKLRDGQRATVK